MQNLADYSNYVFAAYAITILSLTTLFFVVSYKYLKIRKLSAKN